MWDGMFLLIYNFIKHFSLIVNHYNYNHVTSLLIEREY